MPSHNLPPTQVYSFPSSQYMIVVVSKGVGSQTGRKPFRITYADNSTKDFGSGFEMATMNDSTFNCKDNPAGGPPLKIISIQNLSDVNLELQFSNPF